MRLMKHVLIAAVVVCTVAPPAAAETLAVELPAAHGQFDYQIGGIYPPASTVAVLSRDRNESPVDKKYNICYINAMQTQPDLPDTKPENQPYGSVTWWMTNHPDLVVTDEDGNAVMDGEWGEAILDVSTTVKQNAILAIQKGWIDGCKAKKFQAIEPDNLDSYDRSGGAFTFAKNKAYMKKFVAYARDKGLAVAQKNANSEYGTTGKTEVGFSFAIAEECGAYNECDEYRAAYGDLYFEIEYTDNPRTGFLRECRAHGKTTSIIMRDRKVVPDTNPAYHYELCPARN